MGEEGDKRKGKEGEERRKEEFCAVVIFPEEKACGARIDRLSDMERVIGSPGQWVIWVIFHVRVTG